MNPFLLSAGSWDFHPISLAVPFIAMALLGVVKKNGRMLLLSSLVILTCKEHMGLVVAGFGSLWWLRNRSWKMAVAVSLLGVGHLVLVMGVVMPMLSPIGKPVMLGEGLVHLSRYGWLGGSLYEIMHTLLTRPVFVWKTVFEMGGPGYWLLLFTPYGVVLPILGFPYLLPGLADLAANTLSLNPMPRSIWSYHSVGLVPILTAAAIVGTERLSRFQQRFSVKEISGIILMVTLVLGYLFLPLPLKMSYDIWAPVRRFSWSDQQLENVRAFLAGEVSLSVQGNIGSHFSHRREIFLYPKKVGETEGIVLRMASPTTNDGKYENHNRNYPKEWDFYWLDSHLQMDRAGYLASITCLLEKEEYGVAYWDDPWLVFLKGAEGERSVVDRKISLLQKEWQVDIDDYRLALAECMTSENE